MKFLAKIVVAILANAIALVAAATYISGFNLDGDFKKIVGIAIILTVLNFVLKPILKLVFGPVIVLTLGLGIILVNALVLYVLDIIAKNLTIETIPALFYATILVGVVNFVFHLATK
ncbi:MAG: phage holin family protein [Candidatus Liptonbacteria bacterium]|nr:phage holin family protein [Candidatus Liptonbacteria bacterium]